MIERLNEVYLNLEEKEKIMLYFSIVIIFGVIIYFVNYQYFYRQIEKLNLMYEKKQTELHKITKKINLIKNKISIVKNKYKINLQKYTSLKEDLKYLNFRIFSSSKLIIDNSKFYFILNEILKKSSSYHISPNYLINKKMENNLTKYDLTIFGSLNCQDYHNFLQLLEDIKKLNYVKNINKFVINKNYKDLNYSFNINFWSFK